ncbi:MAG: phage tail terminator-like protein [Parvibaculaceae bacterium]|nr:phage tail terminator-like protein [Parvibaculaceae bacterium]
MDYNDAAAAIQGRFQTQWAGATDVGYDGHDFTPPEDANSVRLTIVDGAGFNRSIGSPGSNLVRYAGSILVQIFVPGGEGAKTVRGLADDVAAIFRNATFDGVRCGISQVQGRVEEPPFLQWTLSIPFQWDAHHG